MKLKLRAFLIFFVSGFLLFTAMVLALSMRLYYGNDHYSAEPRPGQIKVACVGDSITFGLGTSEWPRNTYPSVLQDLLGDKYHVRNFGVCSYAVQRQVDLSYRTLPEFQQSLEYDADIVVFMMGSNDTKSANWRSADDFRTELLSLLDCYSDSQIILCTVCRVFFVEELDDYQNQFSLQPSVIQEVSEVIRDVAREREYVLVDINELSSPHREWFADGIHPNDKGSAAIAMEIFSAVRSLGI